MHLSKRAPRRQFFVVATALVTGALGAGCRTPLQRAVANISPRYEAKTPACAQPETGSRYKPGWLWIRGEVLATNPCFVGTSNEADPEESWKEIKLSYADSAGGELNTDFGQIFKASGSASGKQSLEVVLTDTKVVTLGGVRFNPDSSCATDRINRAEYERPKGRTDHVVTEAMKATTISIQTTGSAKGSVTVDTTAGKGGTINGTVTGNSDGTAMISGADLYFAHAVQEFRVSTQKFSCQGVAQGTGCALDQCALKIDSSSNGTWGGVFACAGGTEVSLQNKQLEIPQSVTESGLPEGVSYSITVTEPNVSSYNVEATRWTALALGQ